MITTTDLQLPETPTELTPQQKLHERLSRLTHIYVGSEVWQLVPQSGKDGYYAGRKCHREQQRLDMNEWDKRYHNGEALDSCPHPTELTTYINRVRPNQYAGEDADQWDRYFMAGWFSRNFGIGVM